MARRTNGKTQPTSASWPADAVQRRAVAELRPYDRNPRQHSDAQIDQLANAIKSWGWTMPVLVDETNEIIAGHGRVLAAVRLGLVDVPVMVAHGWSEDQKRAYVIADNKLAMNASWDIDLLRLELTDLQAAHIDVAELGFSPKELENALQSFSTAGAQAAGQSLGDDMTYRVVVDCRDEQHQAAMIEQLQREGLKCRALIS